MELPEFQSADRPQFFLASGTLKRLGPLEVWKIPTSENAERPQSFHFQAILPRPPKIEPVENFLFETTPVLEQRPSVLERRPRSRMFFC